MDPEILDVIYAAAMDRSLWPSVLDALRHSMDGANASIIMQDVDTNTGDAVSVNLNSDLYNSYFDHYARRNILLQRGVSMRTGEVNTDQDLIPKGMLRKTEYYADFLLPSDMNAMLACMVWRDDHQVCCLNIMRSPKQDEFGSNEVEVAKAFAPHLSRAVAVSVRLAQGQASEGLSEEILEALCHGALLLDQYGRILYANAMIRLWGKSADFALSSAGLSARINNGALQKAIAAATREGVGASAIIPRETGRPLSVMAIPVRGKVGWPPAASPRALVLISDPDSVPPPPSVRLRASFGLTPAEASLAQRLVAGDSVQEAADHLGIGIATARQHLSRAMAKTDTRRQGDLIRVLLLSMGPLG